MGPKESKSEKSLRSQSEGLLAEGAPLRMETVRRALAAMLQGIVPVSALPIVDRKRSAISAEGAKVKANREETLARSGLSNSAFGQQELEDIDRNVAAMLSDAEVGELEHLTRLGEQLGFATTQQGMQGLQTSAQLGASGEHARTSNKLKVFTSLGSSVGMVAGGALANPNMFGTGTNTVGQLISGTTADNVG